MEFGGVDLGSLPERKRSIVRRNSFTSIGFVRYWRKPASRPRFTSLGIALALRAITGMFRVSG